MTDILIKNGTVVDGTGAPAFKADVRVKDGVIAEVGESLAPAGERVFDASGCHVTPGFIESHTHYDGTMWWQPDLDPLPGYGATTMILGIGNDVIDIGRIEQTLARFGDRFVERLFTATERAKSDRRANRAASYAKRFAAKEACAKALGTGLHQGVYWRDMGVVNLPGGKPTLALTGGALARLEAITPPGHRAEINLTITDDFPHAQAIVIIEAIPL